MFKKFIIMLVILSIIISLVGCTGGLVTPPQDNEDSLQIEEEKDFNVSSNEGGSFKLSDGAEIEFLPNSLSGDTGIKFTKISYNPNKDRGTEDHTVFYKLEITGNQVFFLSTIKLILPIYSEIPEENAFIIRVFDDGCFGIIQGEIISKKSPDNFISAEINELGTFTTCSFSLSIVIKIARVAAESYNFHKLAKGYYEDNNCQSLKSLLEDAKIEEKEAYNYLFQVGLTKEDGEKILQGVAGSLGLELIQKLLEASHPVTMILSAIKDTFDVIKYLFEINKAGIAVLDYMEKKFKLSTAEYFYDQIALEIETSLANSTGEAPLEVELDGHVYNGTKPYTYYWEFGNGEKSKEYTDDYILPIRYTYQEPGNYYPILHVKDRYGLEGEARADKVTVQESKHHPVITSTPVTSATKDQPYSYNVNATDSDGDTLTYSLTNKPSGMTINSSSGMISWIPSDEGYFNVTVRAYDGELSDTQSFTITVSESNHAPVITSSPPTSPIKDEPYSYDVNATDSDGDTLTYSLPTKPSGMTINSSTGMINWTPTTSGDYNATVKVSDGELFATQSFTIIVLDFNHAPVISDLSANPFSVNVNQTTTVTCIASDPDGDPLTYHWTKNGGFFEGSTSGPSLIWKAPSIQGNYTVSCEVSDGEASDSDQVIISVGDVNHAPVITSTPPTSAPVGQTYSYDVNATDPDGDTLTYSLTTKPSGMTINSSTGLIAWTPTSTGNYNVTVKVSDNGSPVLSDTQSFTIVVSDPPPDSGNKVFLQSGGTLNGTSINPSNPVLTVNTGGSITGTLKVQAIYSGPSGNVVPFGYTPSWGSHSSSYVTVNSDLPVGTTPYNVSINLNAPSTSGTYFLIFASNCEMNLGWTMSQTNWTTGSYSWNDGKDIADLTESKLQSSLSTGYLSLDMLVGSSYKMSTYGITYVKIVVSGTYDLRDIGPAGGYIFYDKGSYSDGWRYLEAAPVSTEWTDEKWGSYGTLIGGTGAGIGIGQSNTTTIVTWLNSHSETSCAAQLCDALTIEGYSDWFLPSLDELNLMYTNLKCFGVGDFTDRAYWSSTEYDANNAQRNLFSIGYQRYNDKRSTFSVRAVRAF